MLTSFCIISQDLKDIKLQLSQNERQKVLEWLVKVDPSPLHNLSYPCHEPGTGDWLLKSQEWIKWLRRAKRCLWIHVIPGAGKTVLVSHLIKTAMSLVKDNENASPKLGCVYYYCSHTRNHDEVNPFLRWVISQLCRQNESIPRSVYELFKAGLEPTTDQLLAATADSIGHHKTVYIFVDAVDECRQRTGLLHVFDAFVNEPRFEKIQLLCSSREYHVIEEKMLKIPTPISMGNPIVTENIAQYVRSTTAVATWARRWPQDLLDHVRGHLPVRANGM